MLPMSVSAPEPTLVMDPAPVMRPTSVVSPLAEPLVRTAAL